jgi:hypothetical protein
MTSSVPDSAVPTSRRWLEIDRRVFDADFPQAPFPVRHRLVDHPLFAIERLLELSRVLPESSVEYNAGDIPLNMASQASPRTGLSAEETIRRIQEAKSWMVLKNVEQDPAYARLLEECLAEVQALSATRVHGMYNKEAFIFLSSPGSTTPFHVDPEHNFLLQIRGSKMVAIFDPFDAVVATEADIDRALFGEVRNLTYQPEFEGRGRLFDLAPGTGAHFPVAAPHWVKNGPEVSVSFSITFRSLESERAASLRQFNMALRRRGWRPTPLGSGPWRDAAKYLVSRVARRLGLFAGPS